MPIKEYACRSCKHSFEELILSKRDEERLSCPKCGSRKLSTIFSVFGVAGTDHKVQTSSRSCSHCSSRSCSTCG